MKVTRKLRRFIGRCLGGMNRQDKGLGILCLLAILLYIYLRKTRNQLPMKGVKQAYDANGMDSTEKGSSCGIVCDPGQRSFYVKTGKENTEGPIICFNGKVYMGLDQMSGDRGINMIVIDDKKMEVTDVKTFDTYEDGSAFPEFMKKVPKGAVVILVSHDEITESLGKEGRQWIKFLGSSLIDNVGFRDAFILVGQVGLEEKQALEFHRKREHGRYSIPLEKKGCFSPPFGALGDVPHVGPKPTKLSVVHEKKEKCGLKTECGEDSFTVSVDTGDGDQRKPSICINGDIVLSDKTKNAGRGFNVVVFNPREKKVTSATVFDTYEKDSASMEVFLENLVEGEIVVALVSDDGQRKLNTHARDLYNQLGSSMIQNLKFRDVWYFVGRKGIKGFTKTEQISYAGYDGTWPAVLKESFCLPYNFEGSNVPPTPKSKRNEARRAFCAKYDGYEHLCDASAVDEPLEPAERGENSNADDDIFRIPILIIPGINHNAIVRTLETTLMQPGINTKMVLVAHDENFPEYAELTTLFGFHNISLSASTEYEDVFIKALEAGWKYFSLANHMIVIEEELILAPDFLNFMQQCLVVLDSDPTLLAVSAWNYNGYDVTSGDRNAIYRVEEFPGLAFLIQRNVYEKYLAQKLSKCCHKRVWDHWKVTNENDEAVPGDIVIPDVSRVFHQPYQSAKDEDKHLVELFQKPRLTNVLELEYENKSQTILSREGQMSLKDTEKLSADNYDALLQSMIENSEEFSLEQLQHCIDDPVLKVPVGAHSKPNFVIFYQQKDQDDYSLLQKINRCFGLFWVPGHPPRNQYRGVIRFFYDDRNVLLVGSTSKFYQYKLETRYVLTAFNIGKS